MIKVLIIFLLFNLTYSQKTIIIDPGHGGYDSGAIGYNNVLEKDMNLMIALKLKKYINASKFKIVYTRQKDVFVTLEKRALIAKVLKGDLFISIHLNSTIKKNGSGVEVYVYNKETSYTDKSIWYGYKICKKLNKLGYKNNGVKFENFSVLRNTSKEMPSILIELGHVTNQKELEYLLQSGLDNIAKSIAKSIE